MFLLKLICTLLIFSPILALNNYKIIEFNPENIKEDILNHLAEDYDFLSFQRSGLSKVLASPEQFEKITETLREYNVDFSVLVQDLAQNVIADRKENDLCVKSQVRLGTDCYRSHGEIMNWLDSLQKQYSNRVSVKVVGKSYERRDLKTITITNGDGRKDKKVIFVDSGMHAREWISPATGIQVIHELVENFEENKSLLKDYDWIVMPVINADGYEYTRLNTSTRMWRKTRQPYEKCFGADPNRNFAYKFGYSGTSSSPCSDTYKGPKPFSEPETTVLRDILHSLKGKMSLYLTLHSHGAYLLYPWGYERIDAPNESELIEVAKAGYNAIYAHSGRKYQVGSAAKLLYPAAGASDDYAYVEGGARISITMELPSGGLMGFNPPPKSIKPYVEESWAGIRAMARVVMAKYN